MVRQLLSQKFIEVGTIMWKCPGCGEEIEDQFDQCWQCATSELSREDAKLLCFSLVFFTNGKRMAGEACQPWNTRLEQGCNRIKSSELPQSRGDRLTFDS